MQSSLQEELKQALTSGNNQKLEQLLANNINNPELKNALTILRQDSQIDLQQYISVINGFQAMNRFKESLQRAVQFTKSEAYEVPADYTAMKNLNQHFTYQQTQEFTAQLNNKLAPAPTPAPSPSAAPAARPQIAPPHPKPRHVPEFAERLDSAAELLNTQVEQYQQKLALQPSPQPKIAPLLTPHPPGT